MQLDENFNEITKPKANTLLSSRHYAHSEANFDQMKSNETSLSSSTNGYYSNSESDKLVDEYQSKMSINLPNSVSSISLASNSATSQLNSIELWRVNPRPAYGADYYMFNYFTMTLNELKDEFVNVIAPTDSRFRSDVRKLELGDLGK